MPFLLQSNMLSCTSGLGGAGEGEQSAHKHVRGTGKSFHQETFNTAFPSACLFPESLFSQFNWPMSCGHPVPQNSSWCNYDEIHNYPAIFILIMVSESLLSKTDGLSSPGGP